MLQTSKSTLSHRFVKLASFTLATILSIIVLGSLTTALGQKSQQVKTNAQATPSAIDEPLFRGYKGVQIGMTTAEVRKILGTATDMSDTQDFYVFSDKESAQIFYDLTLKVRAISVNYLGTGSGVPDCKAVVGTDAEAKPDGSIYKLVRYPKFGYWVAYNRTAGADPLITITIQKNQQ